MENKINYLNFYLMISLVKANYDLERSCVSLEKFRDVSFYEKSKEENNRKRIYINQMLSRLGFKSFNDLEDMILKKWDHILDNFLNGNYNYEWGLLDAQYTGYEAEQYPAIKELFKDLRTLRGKSTIPLYYELSHMLGFGNGKYEGVFDSVYQTMLKDMIDNSLFNPNFENPTSARRPFWTSLIDIEIMIFSKVFLDDRTDRFLLSNGTSVMSWMISHYKKAPRNVVESEHLNLIFSGIKSGKISVFDCQYSNGSYNIDMFSVLQELFVDWDNNPNIKTDPRFIEIAKYLMSKQGIDSQLIISKHPSEARDNSIYLYERLVSEFSENPEYCLKKVKLLKF